MMCSRLTAARRLNFLSSPASDAKRSADRDPWDMWRGFAARVIIPDPRLRYAVSRLHLRG
jgi:hypothetical protein